MKTGVHHLLRACRFLFATHPTVLCGFMSLQRTATHCIPLQHTASHALHRTAARCNDRQHIAACAMDLCHRGCNALQRTATHYNTLQHSTSPCNTLQHEETHPNCIVDSCHCNYSYVLHHSHFLHMQLLPPSHNLFFWACFSGRTPFSHSLM